MLLSNLIGDVVILAVLASPVAVVVGYLGLPFYAMARPRFSSATKSTIFTVCLWLIGLLPAMGLLITYVVDQTIPSSHGFGGEPGLNVGWEIVPSIIGFLLAPLPQFVLCWLFYDYRNERSRISFESGARAAS